MIFFEGALGYDGRAKPLSLDATLGVPGGVVFCTERGLAWSPCLLPASLEQCDNTGALFAPVEFATLCLPDALAV